MTLYPNIKRKVPGKRQPELLPAFKLVVDKASHIAAPLAELSCIDKYVAVLVPDESDKIA